MSIPVSSYTKTQESKRTEILIIKQTSLGDVMHSTFVVKVLRIAYPNARITFLTDKASEPLIRHHPLIDEVVCLNLKRYQELLQGNLFKLPHNIRTIWTEVRCVHKKLATTKYHLALDLQGLTRTLFFLYTLPAYRKIAKTKYPFTQHYRNKHLHAVEEIRRLLLLDEAMAKVLITANKNSEMLYLDFHLTSTEKKNATHLLARLQNTQQSPKQSPKQSPLPRPSRYKKKNIILVVSPFSRWQSKDLPLPKLSELLVMLCKEVADAWIIVAGTEDRANDVNSVWQQLPTTLRERCVNACGQLELREFASVMRLADLVVCVDSFACHLAVALKKKLVVLFASTAESRVGPPPYMPDDAVKNAVVVRAKNCKVCYKRKCASACMQNISTEKIMREVKTLLSRLVKKAPQR